MSFETAGKAVKSATRIFKKNQIENARQDAELLLQTLLSRDRSFLFAHPEYRLTQEEQLRLREWVKLRSQHFPIQYIRGRQEFFSREFLVTPSVLIPRPETELLIDVAMRILGSGEQDSLVLDIGTGSGCIAVTLACEAPHLSIVATDISPEALEVARHNARRHGCEDRIQFLLGDCGEAVSHRNLKFDLIVSNPPYVATTDQAGVDSSVLGYEPHLALFSGPTGLETYHKIFLQAPGLLRPSGRLVLELAHNGSEPVCRLGECLGWRLCEMRRDLAGIERCAVFRVR